MEKKKYQHTDPSDQVQSEFENSKGNNFDVVREESPVKKKNQEDKEEAPLNVLPPGEHIAKKEGDTEQKEPPKMNAGEKDEQG